MKLYHGAIPFADLPVATNTIWDILDGINDLPVGKPKSPVSIRMDKRHVECICGLKHPYNHAETGDNISLIKAACVEFIDHHKLCTKGIKR